MRSHLKQKEKTELFCNYVLLNTVSQLSMRFCFLLFSVHLNSGKIPSDFNGDFCMSKEWQVSLHRKWNLSFTKCFLRSMASNCKCGTVDILFFFKDSSDAMLLWMTKMPQKNKCNIHLMCEDNGIIKQVLVHFLSDSLGNGYMMHVICCLHGRYYYGLLNFCEVQLKYLYLCPMQRMGRHFKSKVLYKLIFLKLLCKC